jgi:hypothetical protein
MVFGEYANQWLSINAFGVAAILEQQLIDTACNAAYEKTILPSSKLAHSFRPCLFADVRAANIWKAHWFGG